MKRLRSVAAALGLGIATFAATTTPADAVVSCVITNPTINNSRFCAKVEVGLPAWYMVGQLQSKDGGKYKLNTYNIAGQGFLLVNWTNSVGVGDALSSYSPNRAKVTSGTGTTWGWTLNP